jgi:hypothetical protein
VEEPAARRDADRVPWPRATHGAFGHRTCPHCRSTAVSATRREEVDRHTERLLLRCGQCEIWRSLVVGPRTARALQRKLRRDRARMARTLWLLENAGMRLEMRDLIDVDV